MESIVDVDDALDVWSEIRPGARLELRWEFNVLEWAYWDNDSMQWVSGKNIPTGIFTVNEHATGYEACSFISLMARHSRDSWTVFECAKWPGSTEIGVYKQRPGAAWLVGNVKDLS